MEVRIAELREARGWSQRQLGELVGATRDQIAGWEKGHLTLTQAIACADVFGVSLEYLACETDIDDRSIRHELDAAYGKLNEEGRRKVMEYARDLAQVVTYAYIDLPAIEGGDDDAQTTR